MVSIRQDPEFNGTKFNRVDRYFIGISTNFTEQGMGSFLTDNGVKFMHLRFFANRGAGSFSAQLNVLREKSQIVTEKGFGPRGIRVTRWVSRS